MKTASEPRGARALTGSLLALTLAGCGGNVVWEEDGGGGSGPVATSGNPTSGPGATGGSTSGGGASTTTGGNTTGSASSVTVSVVASASASTGSASCVAHVDCPDSTLCVFATGTCEPACGDDLCASCGPGTVCNTCATSSAPEKPDCLAACLPQTPENCDEDDPCAEGMACVFESRVCSPRCDGGRCADPNLFCARCVTGSCCGCEDCVDICLFLPD